MPKKVLRKRNIAKAITWRAVGAIDTGLISWILTGNPFSGLKMGMADTISKTLFYYLHERLWANLDLGKHPKFKKSRKRHIVKTLTWRLVGTTDTVLLAWIILGDPLMGLQIGGIELVSKMLLYYFHERTWHKFDYGIVGKPTIKKKDE